MEKQQLSARKGYLDLLRTVSALAVVMIHVCSSPLTNSPVPVSSSVEQTLSFIHAMMNWSVPVFFMLTGYLFLGSERECSYRSMLRHIGKILSALVLFGLFYSLTEQVFLERTFRAGMLAQACLGIISGNLWSHMWFFYSIIGVYLLLPIVKPFFSQKKGSIALAVAMLFVFSILKPLLVERFGVETAFSFPLGEYSLYVFMGAWIAKMQIKRVYALPAALGIAASGAWIAYIVLQKSIVSIDYISLPVCIMAFSMFLLFGALFAGMGSGAGLRELSACTRGIYFVHPFFLNLQIKLLHISPLDYPLALSLPLNCILLFAISGVCIFILRKIPLMRRYIL